MSEKFCLKWNDFQSNITKSFGRLRNEDDFFDVTLVSDDRHQLSAHKLVLSSCSDYFKTILKQNKHSHPLLCLEGISSRELNNVLDYIYNGEVQICQENLERFLEIASRFQLEGLIGGEDNSQDDILEEVVNNITDDKSELEILKVSSSKSSVRSADLVKNVLSVNASDLTSAEDINRQIEELIEKVGVRQYLCKPCGKVSTKKSNANEHAETHMEGLSFACQMCDKIFRTRNARRLHGKQHSLS